MKTYKVKVQVNAKDIKVFNVIADNEKEAWGMAAKHGVIIGFIK